MRCAISDELIGTTTSITWSYIDNLERGIGFTLGGEPADVRSAYGISRPQCEHPKTTTGCRWM